MNPDKLPKSTRDYLSQTTPEGERDNLLLAAACQFRDSGFTKAEAESELIRCAVRDGLSEAQARRTIASAYSRPAREPARGHSATTAQPRREVRAYTYTDEAGKMLFQVVRYEPKDFRQRRPNGNGGWIWDTQGVRRVLYQLPQIKGAPEVWIVEGEKDADSLAALDFCATCNSGGAGNWLKTDFTETLRGKAVLIVPDNDKPGRDHADQVARSLHGIAAGVKIVTLPETLNGAKIKDASDYVAAFSDRTEAAERLAVLSEGAAEWTPATEIAAPTSAEPQTQAESNTGPTGIDAGTWIDAEPPVGAPIVENLFEGGDKVLLVGSSKSRKSFFALQLALALASGKRHFLDWNIPAPCRVSLLNAELKPAHLQRRLHHMARRMGITRADLDGRLQIINTRGHDVTPDNLLTWTRQHTAQVFITDPVYKLLPPNANENDTAGWRPILAGFDKIAEETGAAIIYVHHNPKGRAGDRDARDRGAGSGIVARDYDAGIYITEHKDQEDCLVVKVIVRNYPPRDPFSIRFVDRLFETADEVAPVEKTSINSRPKMTVPDDVAREVVGTGEKSYGDLVKSLRVRGYTEAAAKEAVARCMLAGILTARKEDVFPRRTLYRQTNGTNQRADQQEKP